MKVELTRITKNPILAIEEAASNCYNSEATGDGKIMKHCIKSGHTSVTEFCDFTFHIEGISRALSHQLVRHRMASYAQRSQRYCNEEGFEFVTPRTISQNPEALEFYEKIMDSLTEGYHALASNFNIPNEDARMILPNACTTCILLAKWLGVKNKFYFMFFLAKWFLKIIEFIFYSINGF